MRSSSFNLGKQAMIHRICSDVCLVGAAICLLQHVPVARAQDLGVKSPPQKQPVVVENATVHTISGSTIEKGHVVFDGGRITAVGAGAAPGITAARIIDATGKHVYPGLIGAFTRTGISEIPTVRASRDYAEVGFEGFTAEVYPASAVNPDSTIIPVTRAGGVLTVGVFPSGGAIPGHVSVMRLDGWTWEDMTVDRDAGLVVSWPFVRPIRAPWMDQSEEDQIKNARKGLDRIAAYFDGATAYLKARVADSTLPTDIRFEAMRSVVPRASGIGGTPAAPDRPVYMLAQDQDQILSAVSFCEQRGLSCVIVGGRDAPQCAEAIKKRAAKVICLGTFKFPRRDDSPYDEAFTLPARLEAAGIDWCLASGEETAYERNLPFVAAMAVAHGLDHDEAIKAITIDAARALGVDGTLGSIENGKSATLLITSGDPLEVATRIDSAFIDGREIDLSNKQTALEKKYREKYRQLGQ